MFFAEEVWDVVLGEGYGGYEADGAAADDQDGIHVCTLYFTPGYMKSKLIYVSYSGAEVSWGCCHLRGWSSIAILGCGSVLKVYR